MVCESFLDRPQTVALKGFSALLIAVFHVLISWDFPRVVNLAGSVGVAVFLFLSGYGINESYKRTGLAHYVRKKVRRVVLPYWLFLAVFTLFAGWPGWRAFVLDACFIRSEFWFVPFLVRCYVLYWVGRKFFGRYFDAFFIVAGVVTLNVCPQLEAEQAFSFYAGVLASAHIDQLRSRPRGYFARWAVGGFLVGLCFLLLKEIPAVHALKGTLPYHYILLMIKLPMAVPIIVMPLFAAFMVRSRLLYLSGISSLELYLVHLSMVNHTAHNLPLLLLFIVATVLLTWAYYQVNNKIIARLI